MKKLFAILAALILLGVMTSCSGGGGGSSNGGDTNTPANEESFTNGDITLKASVVTSDSTKTVPVTDSNKKNILTMDVTKSAATFTFPDMSTPTVINFDSPLPALPTDYVAKRMAVYVAGQIYSSSDKSRYKDSPGCDDVWDLECMLSCCAAHDNCYKQNGCTKESWKPNHWSDSLNCDLCNIGVVGCIELNCRYRIAINQPNNCFDANCGENGAYFDCPNYDNCDCEHTCGQTSTSTTTTSTSTTTTSTVSSSTSSTSSSSTSTTTSTGTTSTTVSPKYYTISGKIKGAVISGITITLSGPASASAITDTSGYYSFSGVSNGSYTITPSLVSSHFVPSNTSITVADADIIVPDIGIYLYYCSLQDIFVPCRNWVGTDIVLDTYMKNDRFFVFYDSNYFIVTKIESQYAYRIETKDTSIPSVGSRIIIYSYHNNYWDYYGGLIGSVTLGYTISGFDWIGAGAGSFVLGE